MNGLSREGRAPSVEQRRGKPNGFPGLLLAVSAVLLAAGLALPVITVERLWFETGYSILGSVAALAGNGDWFLAAVVGLFSVVLPVAKTACAAWAWATGRTDTRPIRVLGALSKYSMLDVFVIAIAVLALDGRLLTGAQAGPGIVCFTVSILLSTWAVHRLAGRRR